MSEGAPSRILAVSVDRQLFGAIDSLLDRSYFAVDRVPRGESAVALCRHVAFDMMIVNHPLPDLSLELFLAAARAPGAPCEHTQLVALAAEGRVSELAGTLRSGLDVALSVADPRRLLEEVATRLLRVPPRMSARLLVRLEVACETGKQLLMCQTENLSAGGMLLRTDQRHAPGTRFQFEFMLPGDRAPLRGQAEIVRHTAHAVEKVVGLGTRFVELKADDRKRLEDFLARLGTA